RGESSVLSLMLCAFLISVGLRVLATQAIKACPDLLTSTTEGGPNRSRLFKDSAADSGESFADAPRECAEAIAGGAGGALQPGKQEVRDELHGSNRACCHCLR